VVRATFWVRARTAGPITRRASLGGWLYRVAYHMALKARKQGAARQKREARPARREAADPLAEVTGRELLAVFDEELQHLPECERVALVLCYLEGKTRDEAAREAGCSESTLKRRLERGKERMRARLARRGLALPAAPLAAGGGGGARGAGPAGVAASAGGGAPGGGRPAPGAPAGERNAPGDGGGQGRGGRRPPPRRQPPRRRRRAVGLRRAYRRPARSGRPSRFDRQGREGPPRGPQAAARGRRAD